jgi:hypothetical protein
MPEKRRDSAPVERSEPPGSVSHLVHTLHNYLPVIALGLVVVLVGYIIIAAVVYLFGPSQRITSQTFRVNFKGAERGEYPNGEKFAATEIVSGPILLKVYEQNNLKRFVTYQDFARSQAVLEANLAVDALVRDYQSQIADPRLTAIDRERMQRDYEARLASMSKGQYAIVYMRPNIGMQIPDVIIRKVLNDMLREWANFVTNEQHVLKYRIAMLSPEVVADTAGDSSNRVVNIAILRAKVLRVMENIDQIRALPAGDMARTKADALSLNDIGLRLTEIVRFRLEPLLRRTAAAGLDERSETIRFFETQLAYDERKLDAQQRQAEAVQRTLAMLSIGRTAPEFAGGAPTTPKGGNGSETVMPQLSDTFLDRIIELTSSTGDPEYRQRLSEAYRNIADGAVPLYEAVAYNRTTLDFVRKTSASDSLTLQAVDQQIGATRAEVRQLVVKTQEIYNVLSSSLNPSTELITRTGVPITRVERSISIKQLAIYGVLVTALALPILIFLCLLHNRVREEDEAEAEGVIRTADSVQTTA